MRDSSSEARIARLNLEAVPYGPFTPLQLRRAHSFLLRHLNSNELVD